MVQEKHELAIGLQLSEDVAMLTNFAPSMKEPQTLEQPQDTEGDRCSIPMDRRAYLAARGMGEPIEALRDFLEKCLDQVSPPSQRGDLHVMVTLPRLEKLSGSRIPQAFELLGLKRRNIYLQDYLSSFYYYTVNQRRELWNGDVALLEYQQETMLGYILHIDTAKSPALATVELMARQTVGQRERDGRTDEDWDKERDRLLFELLKKVFERRNVTAAFLVGDYFDKSWAVRSFQYLCGGRHAFQGKNLYTKGACYAAMDRAGMLHMPDILFMGEDIVRENLGMTMRVRGRSVYYPLVTAGVNWYEAHHECEFIADGEKAVCLVSRPMTGGEPVNHILRLKGLPERPPRATRLRLNLYFTEPSVCVTEVEDLGFGEFYRASHQVWTRKIYL